MQNGTRTAVLQASAAQTASNVSGSVGVVEFRDVDFFINVSAVSGTTPTMTITIQDSADGVNWYNTAAVTAAITATGQYRIGLTDCGAYVRASAAIGGTTPSFTYDIQAVGK